MVWRILAFRQNVRKLPELRYILSQTQNKCSPGNSIRSMEIFAGFAGEEASNESVLVENDDFRFFRSLSSEHFYRAMHLSAYARSWDRMSSVCPSVCDVGGL